MMKIEQIIKVERYQFIDNLEHIISPQEIYKGDSLDELLANVKAAFEKAGWEGDGEIGLIWLPPFILESTGDTFGQYIWHVKQDNNGISFLGYIDNVVDQEIQSKEDDYEEQTITKSESNFMIDEIAKSKVLLCELEEAKRKGIADTLYSITLNALQNQIIANLVDYIDEVYLQYAEHVIGQNNLDRIKLKKTKVNLSLDTISDGVEGGYMDSWLTLKSIVGAIWQDFKFWKFSDKFREICNCIDFNCPNEIKEVIIKHVEIRNSIQHHGSQFTAESAKRIGKNFLVIFDENHVEKKIDVWGMIGLTSNEVESLLDAVKNFINLYERHVETRMTTRIKRYIQF